MLEVSKNFPDHQFVVAKAPGVDDDFYNELLSPYSNVSSVVNKTYQLLSEAKAAMVTSGTATLETALFNVPQMVVYKGNAISIGIARMLIKIRFISLVNLIVDRQIVKELIQADYNEAAVKSELNLILGDEQYRNTMLKNYDELDVRMGKPGASAKTAALIVKYTKK